MEFQNEFDVEAPIDEVWDTVLDVERVAPCVPGAQVLERTGENAYKVGIKVKIGPIAMRYDGQVEILEADAAEHRAVMSAKAREARGQGTANARVQMVLSGDGGRSHGTISTDLQLSGRAAAMGRGVIQDVSARLIGQFAENLAVMLSAAPAPAPAAAAAEVPPPPPAEAAIPPPPAPAPAAPEASLDVLSIGAGMAADRLRDPRRLALAVGLLVLIGYLLGRRSTGRTVIPSARPGRGAARARLRRRPSPR
jgi:carbon monoxide dehydrogenase subunit G